jgi:hypothetical protein
MSRQRPTKIERSCSIFRKARWSWENHQAVSSRCQDYLSAAETAEENGYNVLYLRSLLGVAERLSLREIAGRARDAAACGLKDRRDLYLRLKGVVPNGTNTLMLLALLLRNDVPAE